MNARAVLVALAVVSGTALAGCGADAVDPAVQAQVIADTCRGLQERSTGRPARPVDVELVERFLRSEPGGARDLSTASFTRRVCQRALVDGVLDE